MSESSEFIFENSLDDLICLDSHEEIISHKVNLHFSVLLFLNYVKRGGEGTE